MSVRSIQPASPVLSQTVSGVTAVQSTAFNIGYMYSTQVAYLVSVGSGLTATFQLMVSMDGVNYYDSTQVLPSVSGSALIFPVQYSGGFPFVKMQVTPSAGSGTVTIKGSAKGGC